MLPQKGIKECNTKRNNYPQCYLKTSGTAQKATNVASFNYFKLNYTDNRKVLETITCFIHIDLQTSDGSKFNGSFWNSHLQSSVVT